MSGDALGPDIEIPGDSGPIASGVGRFVAPPLESDDARAKAESLGQIMGDHDNGQRAFVPQLFDQHMDVCANARVERAKRLVEQQHLWLGNQRLRQRQALLHAARQLRGIFLFGTRQADGIQHFARFRLGKAAGVAKQPAKKPARLEFQPQHDIAEHGEMRKHRIALEHDAAVWPGFQRDRHALHLDGAARRTLLRQQHFEKGGLAAARWSDQRHESPRRDLQVDAFQHHPVVIFLPDIAHRYHAHAAALALANHGKARLCSFSKAKSITKASKVIHAT